MLSFGQAEVGIRHFFGEILFVFFHVTEFNGPLVIMVCTEGDTS